MCKGILTSGDRLEACGVEGGLDAGDVVPDEHADNHAYKYGRGE